MKNFSRLEFCDEILGKDDKIRFRDIHNPCLGSCIGACPLHCSQ
jgi:hypothetical protein